MQKDACDIANGREPKRRRKAKMHALLSAEMIAEEERLAMERVTKLKFYLSTKEQTTNLEKLKDVPSEPKETFAKRCFDATGDENGTINLFKWLENKIYKPENKWFRIKRVPGYVGNEEKEKQEFVENVNRLVHMFKQNETCFKKPTKYRKPDIKFVRVVKLLNIKKEHLELFDKCKHNKNANNRCKIYELNKKLARRQMADILNSESKSVPELKRYLRYRNGSKRFIINFKEIKNDLDFMKEHAPKGDLDEDIDFFMQML